MGKIFNNFKSMIQEYKDVIPPEAMELIQNSNEGDFQKIPVTQEDKDKFFVKGYEELSDAVFNLLHSGRGMYIVNYNAEFKVNRKSAGFNTVSDLTHYAIWVIETYNKVKTDIKERYDILAEKDKGKASDEILKKVLLCKELDDEIRGVTFNMKNDEDFVKRLALIKAKEESECLAYEALTSLSYHKQIDDIYTALSNIENIHLYNIPPKPLKQNFWDSRTV